MRLVQGIESVEEFFLNPLFASQELDVVDQQHVRLAVFLAELGQRVVLDGVDELVGELLGGQIGDAGVLLVLCDVLADSVKQVCLAQPNPAVEKQRIVGFARRLGDREGCAMSEVVIVAHHEGVEGVVWIEAALAHGG